MVNYKKALDFLISNYSKSEYFKRKPWSMEYRINHCIRTANIGREIARKEGMNEEALAIGCLLHDISYALDFNTKEDMINHGRTSAKMVRPFLEELGYNQEIINNYIKQIFIFKASPRYEENGCLLVSAVGDNANNGKESATVTNQF